MNGLVISEVCATLRRSIVDLTDSEIHELKQTVYKTGIVVLKDQVASAAEFVLFGRRVGEVQPYYEEMYRHPEHSEIFVSSNVQTDGKIVGVPRTGKFWHSDYAFMQTPFSFTITYPQVVSSQNRGTYFIDMADAYEHLPPQLKMRVAGAKATHSVRRYFKIRPSDIYRAIGDVLADVDRRTPPVDHPAVIRHPVTGKSILYASRGFTEALTLANDDDDPSAVLHALMVETGQADDTFTHPNIKLLNITEGDIIVWDNRRFVHHARHSEKIEPTKTFRLTAYDGLPFSSVRAGASHVSEGASLV
ncbi:Alpha-ketoglutarate-dependent taurine dioxygenase [Paraburkholderia caribensis MBA4]|uniref:Alpha-ketoglutarate-dependent taurine dioxygenase n=1 Tax=Paraburkholderia caribensis MBA4 TaxID=1323664 RepID=A0A0P0RGR2_9BURK|nr:TauD/TfdA family dioxygenase [Paraburkholderia caribensis]ALL67688.1 Alpha-ketoglutarate-dependent taurine dioxygenase [Paraburkholderia caribensis MBA4]